MSKSKVSGQKKFSKKITNNDVIKFLINCSKKDSSILDDDEIDYIVEENWIIFEVVEDVPSNSWMDFELFYPDEDGDTLEIEDYDVSKIFIVGLKDYDTAYRIQVFQTTDNQLWLGCNSPD